MAKDFVKDVIKGVAGAAAAAAGTAAGIASGTASALVGKVPAAKVDPANEELYWREHFGSEPYYDPSFSFEDYLPAWRVGWEGRARHAGRSFEDVENDLEAEFHWNRGSSRLLWEQARDAVRAAWHRSGEHS
jgi:hypothetical protein